MKEIRRPSYDGRRFCYIPVTLLNQWRRSPPFYGLFRWGSWFKSLLLRYKVQAGNGTILAVSCLFFISKSSPFSRVTLGNTFTESFQIPDKASALQLLEVKEKESGEKELVAEVNWKSPLSNNAAGLSGLLIDPESELGKSRKLEYFEKMDNKTIWETATAPEGTSDEDKFKASGDSWSYTFGIPITDELWIDPDSTLGRARAKGIKEGGEAVIVLNSKTITAGETKELNVLSVDILSLLLLPRTRPWMLSLRPLKVVMR